LLINVSWEFLLERELNSTQWKVCVVWKDPKTQHFFEKFFVVRKIWIFWLISYRVRGKGCEHRTELTKKHLIKWTVINRSSITALKDSISSSRRSTTTSSSSFDKWSISCRGSFYVLLLRWKIKSWSKKYSNIQKIIKGRLKIKTESVKYYFSYHFRSLGIRRYRKSTSRRW
jgi:hypothetical protein